MATISDALALAVQHHRAGRLQAAEQIYRQILQVEPNHADAIHLMGALAHQGGRHALAIDCIDRAIALNPKAAGYHCSLARAYHALRRLPEAIASYQRAIELEPGFAETLNPDVAKAHNDLGISLAVRGELDQAMGCYRRALILNPDFTEAHNNIGNALMRQGKLQEAEIHCRRVVALKPASADAHNHLGVVLTAMGNRKEAVSCYQRALELKPNSAEAYNNLGNSFLEHSKPDEAIACFRQALSLKPDLSEARNNLANALKEQGRIGAAAASYRQACELNPNSASAHSSLICASLYDPECDVQTLGKLHRQWRERHAAPLEKLIRPHGNNRSPDRRLRIGYVSPDFRDHVVGRNVLPLLREHDHRRFETFCYADIARPDELTRRFQSYADAWRDITGLSDEDAAKCVRDDQIDILVDLAVHAAGNRLLVFARRPAPIQVTFAGYPGTTGLSAINCRLTDPYLDPPGADVSCYSEESIRLPDTFWCYDPLEREIEVNALPAETTGSVTFGCLNNFCKINSNVLTIWAQALMAVDRSRLLMLTDEGTHRRRTLELLEKQGVGPERVTFVGKQLRPEYLAAYHAIDLGLDTFPYNGHTTSLDSLWMGVPVVTLAGATAAGRAGVSQLMNLGLPELIASSPAEFVRIAAELAHDLPRLSRLRKSLRNRMEASPLMAAPRFARGIEAAYSAMWRQWCQK